MAALIQSYCHPPRSPVPRTVHSPPTVIGPQYQPRPWSLEQLFVCQFQGKGGGSRVFSVRGLLITLRLVHRLCMFVAYGVVLGNCTPGTIPSRNAKPTFCTGQAVPALAPLSSALKPDCRTRDGVMKKKFTDRQVLSNCHRGVRIQGKSLKGQNTGFCSTDFEPGSEV